MTVSSTKITAGPYAGNGAADTFSYTFGIADKSEIKVFETDDDGNKITLTVDTDYTVDDVGVQTGGTVTRVAGPLPLGYEWYMRSNYEETQETEFESQGSFFPDIHEKAMDKLTRLVQQITDLFGRSLSFSEDYSGPVSTTLPDPDAGALLQYTNDGLQNVFMSELLNGFGADGVIPLVHPRQTGNGLIRTFPAPTSGTRGANVNSFFINLDGVGQLPVIDFSVSDATGDITFVDAPEKDVSIDITYFRPALFNPAVDGIVPAIHPRIIGDGVTTVFSTPATGTANVTSNSFTIDIDGVAQKPDVDFTIDIVTGDVTFVHDASPDAPANGVSIDITYFRPVVLTGASGTFTSQDSKTITVLNGLITGIV